ncbi:23S rRNA (uracil(1939)-C(5))-methyltransferase RlmD [Elusimicrobiota bacterium]
MSKSKTFRITPEKLVYGGSALGFKGSLPVFVSGAIDGDSVEAWWTAKKKNHGIASIKEIIEPSPYRTNPQCSSFGLPGAQSRSCGGCQWQMIDYAHQLRAKKEILEEAFIRIGKMKPRSLPLEDCVGMDRPWGYRNKAQYPLRQLPSGKLVIGYYQKQSHDIVDLRACPVQLKMFDDALLIIRNAISDSGVPLYNESRHRGFLRHICLRGSDRTNELLIILVTSAHLPQRFIERLDRLKIPNCMGIVQNINPRKTNVIYGPITQTIWGKNYIHEKVLNKTLRISATSFFQTNTEQAENIVRDMINNVPRKITMAVDAYCGAGLFSLFLADKAQRVLAIEENPQSIQDGIFNQKINRYSNIAWIRSKVEAAFNNIRGTPDLIFLDPPREGIGEPVARQLIRMRPRDIIYLSCDPTTLARDIRILTSEKYLLQRVVPFDLFPHTYHIETIAYLRRRD